MLYAVTLYEVILTNLIKTLNNNKHNPNNRKYFNAHAQGSHDNRAQASMLYGSNKKIKMGIIVTVNDCHCQTQY